MIPMVVNEGPIWVVGIAWHADKLAAFLAWWMPLNLVSWLLLVLVMTCNGHRLDKRGRTLWWTLLMTVVFWPLLVGGVIYSALTMKLETLDIGKASNDHSRP